MRTRLLCLAVLLLPALWACAQNTQPPYQNNHLDFQPRSLADLARWRLEALRQGLPRPPQVPTPVVAPELEFIQANARAGAAMVNAVTWVGHATVLVQVGGMNLLTDPIFSERASPLSFLGPKRAQPPGLALSQLPRIDAVLVSHNHYDHMDAASLKALNAQTGGPPLFIVPQGNKAFLAELGIANAVELAWWQSQRVGAAEVVLTPVQHWSARGLNDRMATLWGGYAVFTPGFNAYFGGDTGYSRDFADTRTRLAARGPFDLALLPIGAYEPRWFMADQHINPAEAVQAFKDLGAKQALGIHWGTFELTDESLDEPPRALAAALREARLDDGRFFLLAIGQTRRLPAR